MSMTVLLMMFLLSRRTEISQTEHELDPGNNTEYSTISVDVAWWQDIQYWVR
jgi:hypothetical protein